MSYGRANCSTTKGSVSWKSFPGKPRRLTKPHMNVRCMYGLYVGACILRMALHLWPYGRPCSFRLRIYGFEIAPFCSNPVRCQVLGNAEETGMRISVYHFSAFLLWFGNNNSSFSSSSSSFHLRFLRHMRLLRQVRQLRLLRLDFFSALTCLEPTTFWTKTLRATTRLAGQAISGISFGQIKAGSLFKNLLTFINILG